MYIVSTFELQDSLELAVNELLSIGLQESDLLAVPLDKRAEESRLFDSLHRADGVSTFDGAAIFGTICMVLGSIYGFIWEWGPILWGLIGAFAGGLIGFLFDFFYTRNKRRRNRSSAITNEVVLMVKCPQDSADRVCQILWKHHAIGLAQLEKKSL
jgi:hypothetical protein